MNAIREVFDFGSPPFVEVVHRLRLDVFATAMRHGVDLVFTNNSAWGGDDGWARFCAFVEEVERVVRDNDGVACFVNISAPESVLAARVGDVSRAAHGTLTDVRRLRELLATIDGSPVRDDHLRIDSSVMNAADAATRILEFVQSRQKPL